MNENDDELLRFDAVGATPLPAADHAEHVACDGARIWVRTFGAGPAVVLSHGGFGNGGNFGYQVPYLVARGHRVVVIDSRGHGRSSRDDRPFSYRLLADDLTTVLDRLRIDRAALVGWSDGACTSLVLARHRPERVAGVLFFACNMDNSGTLPFVPSPVIDRCLSRHRKDYQAQSPDPEGFDALFAAVGAMQRTEPDYSAAELAAIATKVMVLQAEGDEFIARGHAEYLARTIPDAQFILLPGVSHFAPVQRPDLFNQAIADFLASIGWAQAANSDLPKA